VLLHAASPADGDSMKVRDIEAATAYRLGQDEAQQEVIADLSDLEAVDAESNQATELRQAYREGRDSIRGVELVFRDLENGARFHFLGSWPGTGDRIPGWRTYVKYDQRRFSRSDDGKVTMHTVRVDTMPVARELRSDPPPAPELPDDPGPDENRHKRSRLWARKRSDTSQRPRPARPRLTSA
jgi:hypothetical protein